MTVPTPATEAARWLRQARTDLTTAELVSTNRMVEPTVGCFHAQQSGEKALKAILVFLQVRFPFSHDLNEIRLLIPQGWQASQPNPAYASLSQWAIEGRYPGNWPEPTEADCDLAARQARDVWEAVLADLDQHGFDTGPFR